MLFRHEVLTGIAEGRITCAFRRWRRPSVRSGTELRTAAGLVRIESVEQIDPAGIDDDDARRAGFPDAASVLHDLRGRAADPLYRIRLSFAGADPRVELRERADIDDDELDEIRRRLARLDKAGRRGPWTASVLRIIAEKPGHPAGELAAALDVEKEVLKRDVRKLKEMGLTISLEPGYRLSPRGEEACRRLGF